MAIPAMAAVRRAFEGRSVVLAALSSIAPLFEEITPAAPDEILAIDRTTERRQLQAAQADAILLMPSAPRPRRPVHQVQYYLDLVRGLGIDAADDRPRLAPQPATLAKADALLLQAGAPPGMPIVGFAPGAAYGHAKRWPPDRVAQVIAGLARQGMAAL